MIDILWLLFLAHESREGLGILGRRHGEKHTIRESFDVDDLVHDTLIERNYPDFQPWFTFQCHTRRGYQEGQYLW